MSEQYEIEIKSLLGSKSNADALIARLQSKNNNSLVPKRSKQLNHYFTYTDLSNFYEKLLKHIPEEKKSVFTKIIKEGKNFSIRTREVNDSKVILVIKASLDDQSSSNGISRMEFESEMKISLRELDQLLLDSGLQYQAKWSRAREEYDTKDAVVCIDKNAGYGYLAEFEKVVEDKSKNEEVKKELFSLMDEFGVEELKQDRLERMFDFYNKNWSEYYGTDKTIIIE